MQACMCRHSCPGMHVQAFMRRHACAGIHVQAFVCKHACAGIHAQAFMCRHSCAGMHVQAFMRRHSCAGIHVQAFVCKHACAGIHAQAFMCRHSYAGMHVQAFMPRHACAGIHVQAFMCRHALAGTTCPTGSQERKCCVEASTLQGFMPASMQYIHDICPYMYLYSHIYNIYIYNALITGEQTYFESSSLRLSLLSIFLLLCMACPCKGHSQRAVQRLHGDTRRQSAFLRQKKENVLQRLVLGRKADLLP